ncbi:class F sortase [Cellulomonas carbonis]|uniref:class F sortase n=1 Tax=Cellulomonas carbonis TaxID=1386092 RepID=UPI000694C385|nr:class F sortase [Cellulomonas carbonis]GGC00091.1 hypothetical protein GCM10010972_11050 [Cellulomonas carbonis]
MGQRRNARPAEPRPGRPPAGGRRPPRATLTPAAALALVVALSIGACASADDDAAGPVPTEPAPTTVAPEPAPTPTPARSLPDVPVRSADLSALEAQQVVEPTGLTIPAIDVRIPVEPVGVQADGQMEIPPLAEVGGWYRFGASPADTEGTAVVAAHVDSIASEGLGPFARLQDLAAGDVVEVALADGATRTYTVTSVERTPKPQVGWEDVFVRDGGHRLVLVTCGGTFRRDVRSYSDNVIVTAEPSP